MNRDIVIVGAGIVGTCLAQRLSSIPDVTVRVLERDSGAIRGSTALAPGLIGLFNDSPILTRLAKKWAATYERLGGSEFRRSGSLEVATSDTGAAMIARRVDNARAAGLRATIIDGASLPATVTSFVDPTRVVSVAYFPDDGAASPRPLTRRIRTLAAAQGTQFLGDHYVIGIERRGTRWVVATTHGESYRCDELVLAVGVWGPNLGRLVDLDLAIVPVAHPYVRSPRGGPHRPGPFVRWPEQHAYARVHGDRLGIGSYDHPPIAVSERALRIDARLPWRHQDLSTAIGSAQRCFSRRRTVQAGPAGQRRLRDDPRQPSIPRPSSRRRRTRDRASPMGDARGSCRCRTHRFDQCTIGRAKELAIDRFDGIAKDHLRSAALEFYSDIYANFATP